MVDVGEHLKLVHFVLQKMYHFDRHDQRYDDFVGIGNIWLVIAAKTYKKDAKFSTYAITCIYNGIHADYVRRHRQKRTGNTVSLHTIFADNLYLKDTLKDPREFETEVEIRDSINRFTAEKLTPGEQSLLTDMLKNKIYGQKDIAKKRGITQGAVFDMLKKIRRKWREYENAMPEYQKVASTGKEMG